jgi:glycosyltransferase involved in cell wall biosynthesis
MKISVIIPVYNDLRIRSCITSLLAQDFSEEYEIIVVDNNSDAAVKESIRGLSVYYVHEEKRGSYFARNCGLQVASGEIVAFIDADCVADAAWLRNLVSHFDEEDVGGIGGKILKPPSQTWVQAAAENLAEQQLTPQSFPFLPYPYIVTANAAYRMSILRKLEGFDTQFQSGGDVDLAQRVQGLEYRIITEPDAIVYHAPRHSFRAYFKQYFTYAVGHTLLFRKYRKIMKMRAFLNIYPLQGLLLFILSGNILFMLIRGFPRHRKTSQPEEFLKLVKYVALIFGNLYGSLKHRVVFL